MKWGYFLVSLGRVFSTAGLAILLYLKFAWERDVPSIISICFALGLAIMLLGHLILYAIPKGDDDR